MTEEEAKRVILEDPGGNILRRLEAVDIAKEKLGDGATMAEIWKWAEATAVPK